MSKATSSKKTTTTKKTAKTASGTATRKTTARKSTSTARKSPTTARKTTAKKTTTAKKAEPAKKAAVKKSDSPTKSTTAKKAAPKNPAAAKTTKKAAAPKSAAKTARKTTSGKGTANASSSPKTVKQSEKKSVKSAAKLPAAKANSKAAPESAGDDDKPKIAPAPMRPALRVAKRAEARRDKNQTFKVNTQIIYPAHGVGYIDSVEKQSIADIEVELFVIDFEHEKMKLRVPVVKAAASGMRNLSTAEQIDGALELLEGKARIKRTMWSRRAQEYEAKINSGDLISVAEVVRDLYRADDQPEQSYSERQLFEQARERFGREVAAVRKKTLEKAIEEIHEHLAKKEKVDAS